ncbi:hypothetical protein [Actibacterium sp. 188UL27-1]|uniref:hypothetical protein n=1 Tax=Actibacterium sp. 188UL27-1 TaxID=2786961 RepID=UPI00195C76C4|nr:hypothetical protein [Actibacterium sp. 188UL27-1]MBM7066187.1 hypothetical protein [Actibacterium sp. 188UL27-1]
MRHLGDLSFALYARADLDAADLNIIGYEAARASGPGALERWAGRKSGDSDQ